MKNLGVIQDPKDIITKEYLDEGIGKTVNTLEDNVAMAESDIELLQADMSNSQTNIKDTQTAVKNLQDTYVPNTRKVNGKSLDADITLTASDVEALPLSGGTMTGYIDLNNNLITNIGGLKGNPTTFKLDIISSNLDLNEGRILHIGYPTNTGDAANKLYVDDTRPSITQSSTIATSAWVTNTNSEATIQEKTDYPFMATVSISGITSNDICQVVYSYDDQIGGNFAPCAYTTTDGVIIEAKEIPSGTVTLNAIIIIKA